MSIKETIKYSGSGATIQFSLGSGIGMFDYQQQIDAINEETKEELVNPIIDHEVRSFSYAFNDVGEMNLIFQFSRNGTNYYNNFIEAWFSSLDISNNTNVMRNSFFIWDFYDSPDDNTQSRIFTNYLTKINGEYDTGTNNNKPYYKMTPLIKCQFYKMQIPKSFLDAQTGTTATGYTRFSFYNAKTGGLTLFFNKDNDGFTVIEKPYFKTELNLTNMTWSFIYDGTNPSPTLPTDATARQYKSTDAYSQKVNDGVENFENEQQEYPDGDVFVDDGTYENSDGTPTIPSTSSSSSSSSSSSGGSTPTTPTIPITRPTIPPTLPR